MAGLCRSDDALRMACLSKSERRCVCFFPSSLLRVHQIFYRRLSVCLSVDELPRVVLGPCSQLLRVVHPAVRGARRRRATSTVLPSDPLSPKQQARGASGRAAIFFERCADLENQTWKARAKPACLLQQTGVQAASSSIPSPRSHSPDRMHTHTHTHQRQGDGRGAGVLAWACVAGRYCCGSQDGGGERISSSPVLLINRSALSHC